MTTLEQSTPYTLQVRKPVSEYRAIADSKAPGPKSEAVPVAQRACLLFIPLSSGKGDGSWTF